jgi:hypothetical protein
LNVPESGRQGCGESDELHFCGKVEVVRSTTDSTVAERVVCRDHANLLTGPRQVLGKPDSLTLYA